MKGLDPAATGMEARPRGSRERIAGMHQDSTCGLTQVAIEVARGGGAATGIAD
jgi:hypothetical protein